MRANTQDIANFMAFRIRAREVGTVREVGTALPKVVEQAADYQRSGEIASMYNGTRIRLERLPQLLNDPDFVKSIEGTDSYKRNGYTWFWTDTVGTNLSGYYRINPQGKTLDEMFTPISESFDRMVEKVPFDKLAYFWDGDQPLSVHVRRWVIDLRRLNVYGHYWLDGVAPVVVVEQAQASSQAKPKKIANGFVVPTEKFNAAKEAFRKVEPTMHPDLADAFRAVFGE